MGNTFEIWSWQPFDTGLYHYVQMWAGEDEGEAFAELHRLKATDNHPCLKFEWR